MAGITGIGQMMEDYVKPGGSGWPHTAEEWEAAARDKLEPGPFGYIAGGAGAEHTMRANLEAFYRWRLRPRMLRGTAVRDLSVEVLGLRSPVPFLLAPIGVLSIAHPDAELAVARAARAVGIPIILSTAATTAMEPVAEAAGNLPRWYQLYWNSNRDVVRSFVQRAEAAGYSAIVVTLDTLTLGWRDRDLQRAYLPFLQGEGIGQYLSDPVFRQVVGDQADTPQGAGIASLLMHGNLGLTWADFAWLREQTTLPLLVKGVLTAEDARTAREIGIEGIIVSNHGGRQVDGAVAALDALVEVREALGAGYPVLFDSGVRRAADVIKAIALGADAILLGRPYVWGLAVGGQEGVERVLKSLWGELDVTMALLGARSISELDRSWISEAPDRAV